MSAKETFHESETRKNDGQNLKESHQAAGIMWSFGTHLMLCYARRLQA